MSERPLTFTGEHVWGERTYQRKDSEGRMMFPWLKDAYIKVYACKCGAPAPSIESVKEGFRETRRTRTWSGEKGEQGKLGL